MTFSYKDLLSYKEILADVLVNVDDKEQRLLTPGWYKRQVKLGLDKLNYQAPFIERFKDFKMPSDLIVEMPAGSWDVIEVFVWNGASNDCCEEGESCCDCVISSSVRLFHKDNFHTYGYQKGYTAKVKTGQADYYIKNSTNDANVYFYYSNEGKLYLSDICANFQNVRVIYNGTANTDIDTVKFIPPFCREAIIGYVTERVFFALKVQEPKYRLAWADAKQDLYGMIDRMNISKWDLAISLLKAIDTKYRDDLDEYLSRMNY